MASLSSCETHTIHFIPISQVRTLRQLQVEELAQHHWAGQRRSWDRGLGMGSKALPHSHYPKLMIYSQNDQAGPVMPS